MRQLQIGMRVVAIDESTGEIRKGKINSLYGAMKIAVVKFDDGNVEKVPFNRLGVETETKAQEEKSTEPEEKSEITITPNEFRDITSQVIAKHVKKMGEDGAILTLAFTVLAVELHKALFFDQVDND